MDCKRVVPLQRLIARIPLDVLWDEDGEIDAIRERWLSTPDLRAMLQQYPVEFFVADVGYPLRRVGVKKCYDFWKSEVANHLVQDPEVGFHIETFPGNYAYVASEWSGSIETPIVLLEKHH